MGIRFGILTVSDRSSRGERPDGSGPTLIKEVENQGWDVSTYGIVPDDHEIIILKLTEWCDHGNVDVILTTGGTGFSLRDITPEATLSVCDRITPGISEAIRSESLKITPHAMLSRAVSGIRGKTLIINLPGSPKAAYETFHIIIPILDHAVQLLRNPKNAEASHQ